MENNNIVIIFGATGTIGAYTALDLIKKDYSVIAVGNRKTDNGFFNRYNIPYYSVDIRFKSSFDLLPKETSSILHFASPMPSKMEGYHPETYISGIVNGTLNVLEYARKSNAERIVFTQTRADSNHLLGTTEPVPSDINRSFPIKGDHSVYTICKNAAVDLIEHYFYEYQLRRFILRLPTIYAWHPNKYFYVNGEKKIKAYRQLMDLALDGKKLEIWGDPSRRKEIVYIKDLVQIINLTLQSDKSGGVYNVGNGRGISLEEQIKGIAEVFKPLRNNGKSQIIYKKEKPNGRQFIHDISKTHKELGFRPLYSYREMLEDFKQEMLNNRFRELWGD